jgi:AcrR family transcriptional regulator
VTLTAIAARTGVHKSAVLRYFDNREALLLEICGDEWQAWADELTATALGTVTRRPTAAEALCSTLEGRPLFCDLLAQTPVLLEREAPVRAVHRFKLDVLRSIDVAAQAVQALAGELSRSQAVQVVGVATSVAGTVWHLANPPAALDEVYRTDPRLSAACIEFRPQLEDLLRTFLLGLAASDGSGRRPVASPRAGRDGRPVSPARRGPARRAQQRPPEG